MSIQPDALDRSVLESKKLDELQAIASAIGAKAGSRARKAQVVDAILSAAGVDESAGSSNTSPAAAAADTSAPAEAAAPSSSAESPAESSAESSPASGGSGNGNGRPARQKAPRPSFSADPWADAADEQEKFRQKAERRTSGGDDQGSLDLDPGAGGATAEPSTASSTGESGVVDSTAASADAEQVDESATSDSPTSENTTSAGSESNGRRGDRNQAKADQGAENRDKGDRGGDNRGRGDQGKGQNRGDQNKGDQNKGGENKGDQNKGGENKGGENKGGENRGKGQNQGEGGKDRNRNNDEQPEPGNRRRRRRGRDREREDSEPQGEPVEVSGMLDLRDEGYGFLRTKGFLPSRDDVYVSAKQVRQSSLRKGDLLTGMSRPATRNEKNPGLLRVDTVNGMSPEEAPNRPKFEDLTPLFPDEKLKLERPDDPGDMTARIIDLIAPIGKGQRGLIVSPPKAGKTMIMKTIATAIEANNPEVHLMVLLVDERPEEVTDMRRTVKGEVVSSTFDRPSDEHTQVAELSIERAKRLAEMGKDVVVILDGITRLARAYNLAAPATGRIMSGGVDSGALYPPKRFFGAARNLEEGGSLTILATALIETGSRMDEVIFEEFKGTGNMELRLDRRLAERRIYPAIDVDASSTRQEQLLFDRRQVPQVMKLRRVLSGLAGGPDEGRPGAGLELMVDRLKTFASNDEFLAEIARAPSGV